MTTSIPIAIHHDITITRVLSVRVVEKLPVREAKTRLAVRPHDGARGEGLRLAISCDGPNPLAGGTRGNCRNSHRFRRIRADDEDIAHGSILAHRVSGGRQTRWVSVHHNLRIAR